ncbi:MYXO-CTERM domain-containing protein [Chitinivorax tropicus]|uniref:MYXO-CTERM domain-containing protein n=1 Tax=Chitinivorax tropicus TaxID=714531 RepID=A0A840MNK5_9PROT|nr:NF038129 family PEP-CTERM protein [Chitinivorax tropicus]MBB5020228.1 MYXO-CTERM domain-containing protein [Chitinivorax tropicus]
MLKRFKEQVLAGLAGLCMAASSWAGPMYQVSVDTHTLESQQGFIDFGLIGLVDSPLAKALVSKLQGGKQTGPADILGNVSAAGADWLLVNDANSDLLLPWQFGSNLSFEVELSGDWLTQHATSGTTFAVKLFDQAFNSLLTNDSAGDLFRLELSNQQVGISIFGHGSDSIPAATVTASTVPEPDTALLGALAVGALWLARRRQA